MHLRQHALFFAICLAGASLNAQALPADGVYFAQEEGFSASGWRDQVVIRVSGGKVESAIWNGVSNLGGLDKRGAVKAGAYPMVKAGKAASEWDAQANRVQDFFAQSQDIGFKRYGKDGKTDAISGASIDVEVFFRLARQALASAPITKGIYPKDGWYFAQEASFSSSGWKDNVLVTVVNGRLVDIVWNSVSSDKGKKSRLVEDAAGRYGLEKASKLGTWSAQAKKVQDAIIMAQDPKSLKLRGNGAIDGISGASIKAVAVGLCEQALGLAH